MVGSVGTVLGMIILFGDIVDKYGVVDIILAAAAGIKLKLLVTVWGLIVGIPAYVAYNYFTTVINGYVLSVEESATATLMEQSRCNCRCASESDRQAPTATTRPSPSRPWPAVFTPSDRGSHESSTRQHSSP